MADSLETRIPLDPPLAALREEDEPQRPVTALGACLVTGGSGYLGRHLAIELLRRGHRVRVFDLREPGFTHDRLEVRIGDVTAYEDVRKACLDMETVFHTAAVLDFRGFARHAWREESWAVNVRGVENVIRGCVEAGARRLVHTSSNNVTLEAPVIDGDESRPYARRPRDLYTETKIQGERAVLVASGRGGLLTCAIRPGGIYGPGDRFLLSRLVTECARGRFVVTIGDGSARSDNTYIGNLVDGEIEAARHLVRGAPLCGQAYFVTDGAPINYFEFFRPFVEGMGFPFPRRRVPERLLHAIAWVGEALHCWLGFPRPFLTRHELAKITVSHYNRIAKARRDFGWEPPVSVEVARERCLSWCREELARIRGPKQRSQKR